jgi:type VII secretion-associated serine protease mycosin
MRRWSGPTGTAVAGVALTLFMLMATSSPAWAASPKPLEQQWWFTTWDVQDGIWPISQGEGVIVAVLDSGVQADIPELAGVVLPGLDTSGHGTDGRTDLHPDLHEGGLGHGTGMATLIAAQGTGTGFVGVAPGARILPVVSDTSASYAPGIHFAVDNGAKVINISQAQPGRCPDEVQEAVGYALEHDVVVLAGAGNDGDSSNKSMFPANCAGVLAVGGVDYKFNPFTKTQRQPYVTLAAPATAVGSVVKDGQFHTSEGGTSSATALTSAAAALIRSTFPQMSAREVVQRLIASARDVGPPGKDDQSGYGLVRPHRALGETPPPANTPNPVFDSYDTWAEASQKAKNPPSPTAQETAISGEAVAATIVGAVALLVVIGAAVLVRRRNRRRQPATASLYPGSPPQFRPAPGYPAPPGSHGR